MTTPPDIPPEISTYIKLQDEFLEVLVAYHNAHQAFSRDPSVRHLRALTPATAALQLVLKKIKRSITGLRTTSLPEKKLLKEYYGPHFKNHRRNSSSDE